MGFYFHPPEAYMYRKIVADSTANLVDKANKYLASVPLKVITDEREFIDDENLDIEEMSKYLKEYKGRSSTSCPGVADWLESFGDADEVFGVCLTSKISGGYNAAMTAAAQYMEEHPGRKVHMVDTHTTGPELEVLVEKLQELCATDKTFEEIVEEITEYNKHTNLMFALASVDNFAKNGRVNPLVAKAASVLGIRIVGRASEEGELEPISKIRGEKAAIAKLADYIVEEGFKGGRIIIRHSFNENAAKALADKILSKFPNCNLSIDINFGLCVYYAEPGSILVGFEN